MNDLFRDIPPLDRARIQKWLAREVSPPQGPDTMSDDEIANVLQVMVENGELFDGTTIWIAEALCRLRNGRKGRLAPF